VADHPLNRGLREWIDAPDPVACTSPYTAEIGEYIHRLALVGGERAYHGDEREGLGRRWRWDMFRQGWERVN
jgi:hypothetical protein